MAASSQKIGERAGVRGLFSNAAIFESPLLRSAGHRLPQAEKGLRFTRKKSTVIPRQTIKVQSLARRGEIVYFVMPTSVGELIKCAIECRLIPALPHNNPVPMS
jgi:hypothetical protein